MVKENISHLKEHEQKILKGVGEISKSQKMFDEAIVNVEASLKQLTEAQEKAEAGKRLLLSGYHEVRNELKEAEEEIERLKSSPVSNVDFDEEITEESESTLDNKKKNKETITEESESTLNNKKKNKETMVDDEKVEQEISSDSSKIDVVEDEFIDKMEKMQKEEEKINEENNTNDRANRRRIKEEVPLFSRRDRNRLIMLSFFLGIFIAFFRVLFEGWPIIVWPPYNYILIHENSFVRSSIRWFIEDLIAVYILDFEPLPIHGDGARDGNDALTIPRKYRGKNADLYHG